MDKFFTNLFHRTKTAAKLNYERRLGKILDFANSKKCPKKTKEFLLGKIEFVKAKIKGTPTPEQYEAAYVALGSLEAAHKSVDTTHAAQPSPQKQETPPEDPQKTLETCNKLKTLMEELKGEVKNVEAKLPVIEGKREEVPDSQYEGKLKKVFDSQYKLKAKRTIELKNRQGVTPPPLDIMAWVETKEFLKAINDFEKYEQDLKLVFLRRRIAGELKALRLYVDKLTEKVNKADGANGEYRDVSLALKSLHVPSEAEFFKVIDEALLKKSRIYKEIADLNYLREIASDNSVLAQTEMKAPQKSESAKVEYKEIVNTDRLKNMTGSETADKDALRGDVSMKSIAKIVKDFNSDEAYELLTSSIAELSEKIATSIGLVWKELETKNKNVYLGIKFLAKEIKRIACEQSPNKISGDTKKISFVIKEGTEPISIDVPNKITLGEDNYLLNEEVGNNGILGRGGFGTAVCYKKKDGKTVVLKMPNDSIGAEPSMAEAKLHRQVMRGGKSENLMALKGVIPYKADAGTRSERDSVMVVMDFSAVGDMDVVMDAMNTAAKGPLSQLAKQLIYVRMMKQAILGVKELQEENLVHGDIKPGNFLVGEDGSLKVGDFGTLVVADGEKSEQGTPEYMPLVMPGGDAEKTTRKFDVFSLGVTLNVLFHKAAMDGEGKNDQERYKKNTDFGALGRLIQSMLNKDPDKRPTLDAILDSSFMKEEEKFDERNIKALMAANAKYSIAWKSYEVARLAYDEAPKKAENAKGKKDIVAEVKKTKKEFEEAKAAFQKASDELKKASDALYANPSK
jgi:hypothetical protein